MPTTSSPSPDKSTENNPLKIARHDLLEVSGVDEHQLQNVLDRILDYKVDAADLYFQATRHETWSLEDGSYNIEQGVGVGLRSGVLAGAEAFAFSYVGGQFGASPVGGARP